MPLNPPNRKIDAPPGTHFFPILDDPHDFLSAQTAAFWFLAQQNILVHNSPKTHLPAFFIRVLYRLRRTTRLVSCPLAYGRFRGESAAAKPLSVGRNIARTHSGAL